jgi:hypothetical protein
MALSTVSRRQIQLRRAAHCTSAASNSDLANCWTCKCRGIRFSDVLGDGRIRHDVSVSGEFMPFTSFHLKPFTPPNFPHLHFNRLPNNAEPATYIVLSSSPILSSPPLASTFIQLLPQLDILVITTHTHLFSTSHACSHHAALASPLHHTGAGRFKRSGFQW